jgi:hypothetical protein
VAIKVGNAAVRERHHAWRGTGVKEHRAGGVFIRRPHWPSVLGLAAFLRSTRRTSWCGHEGLSGSDDEFA